MKNAIKFLRIQHFKSLKDVTLHPRRVNLLIGEPNVGKSNLLEAMSLLGSIIYEPTEKFLGSFIRYEEPRQLFYDNLVANTIKVETDKDVASLLFENSTQKFEYLFIDVQGYQSLAKKLHLSSERSLMNWLIHEKRVIDGSEQVAISNLLQIGFDQQANNATEAKAFAQWTTRKTRYVTDGVSPYEFYLGKGKSPEPPKPYTFHKHTRINQDTGRHYLSLPSGNNLIEIIQTSPKLRKEVARLFEYYGQKLQLRMDERRLEILKDQDGMVYSYPYSSVADTLQRLIFYLAAIESNDDAVLLFEEPEAHSFPVYVAKLGRRIVESRNNQFFIDTHSPYLITEVLETMLTDEAQAGELAIFAAYYEDHQTKVHQLSDEEIRSIRADGIDVFYNMKRFTTGAADA